MSVGRYGLGCLELLAIVAPVLWAAGRLRGTMMPGFTGPRALLAEVTVGLSWLVVEAELLGSVGALHGAALAGASVASSIALGIALRGRRSAIRPPATIVRQRHWWGAAMVAVAAGLIAFEQAAPTLQALHGGVSEFDSLAYHLPTAARWVQQGTISPLHQLYPGSLWAYYPYNAELLHAVGMAAFGRDLLSPFLNVGFLGLALIACWSIGATRAAGTAAVLAGTMVLTTLQFAGLAGGTALNDIPAVAMVLVTVALVSAGPSAPWEVAAAALAGGWAIGTKPDAALTVVLVAAGAVMATRRMRWRAAAIWAAGLLGAGGYWYVRDLVAVGTPVPGLASGLLPTPRAFPWPLTFVHGLHTGADSLGALSHGFDAALGPTWPVVFAVALVGLVAGLAPNRGLWERAAAAGGIANLVIWPLTPFTQVVVFAVRYMAPGLMLGVVLFACAPWLAGPRRRRIVEVGFAAAAAVAVAHVYSAGTSYRLAAVVVALALAAVVVVAMVRPRQRSLAVPLLLGVAVLLAIAEPGAQRYLRNRYRLADFHPRTFADTAALERVFSWARGVHRARIGIEGGELQYPLYGADLSNFVQYVGRTRADGGFARLASCGAWRRAIDAGHYGYVITVPWGTESNSPPLASPQGQWTASDPAATVVVQPGDGIVVYAIHGRLGRC